MNFSLSRRLAAEALGTLLLVAVVVGSGIMADNLSDDVAVSLLGNTIPTGAILVVLITGLGPVSGAHFNPAVTLAFLAKGDISLRDSLLYIPSQIVGGIAGAVVAHLMFALDPVTFSQTVRTGPNQWFAEFVATFSLMGAILMGLAFVRPAVPWLVGLAITAGYWFTASTSFANPAVAIARSFTDTFSGIRPIDVPYFVVAQVIGALVAVALFGWLLRPEPESASSD